MHDKRFRRYGSDELPERPTDAQKFAASYTIDERTGCHVWRRGHDSTGYGYFRLRRGPAVRAHRWAWEQQHGPVPANMVLLHLCNNRGCCNPEHLRLRPFTRRSRGSNRSR